MMGSSSGATSTCYRCLTAKGSVPSRPAAAGWDHDSCHMFKGRDKQSLARPGLQMTCRCNVCHASPPPKAVRRAYL